MIKVWFSSFSLHRNGRWRSEWKFTISPSTTQVAGIMKIQVFCLNLSFCEVTDKFNNVGSAQTCKQQDLFWYFCSLIHQNLFVILMLSSYYIAECSFFFFFLALRGWICAIHIACSHVSFSHFFLVLSYKINFTCTVQQNLIFNCFRFITMKMEMSSW